MASISDFNINLVDGGLNFSTTDTNYQGGGDGAFIYLESADKSAAYSSSTYFSSGGNGLIQWTDFGINEAYQPSLPLNITVAVNDDDNPGMW